MKKTTLSAFMLVIFSLFSLAVFGQGTIKGKVIDSDSNEGLIGATVVVQGTTTGISTNLDGTFAFEAPSGDQILLISYIGYISINRDISLRDGETIDLGEIALESSVVGLEEILITSSFAKDRQTPVSLSTIQPIQVEERLGSQEFPEIFKTTPSIYVTKDNGGYGDSRITLRGFDTYNVGVLVNGIPVNDMESSKVYWSNWTGLSDVMQTAQVQRGLGASKLGLSSVGGTINIISKATDAEKGGSIYTGIGNSGYRKEAFTVSTGLMENGWAMTVSGSRTRGDGYVKATDFNAFSYFMNVSKRINDQQRITFTVFGSPQWHHQRGNGHTIEYYRNHKDGVLANATYGIREGKIYGGAYGKNFFHKPQGSLNHYWNINEKSFWTNVLYMSIGRGGSRVAGGENRNLLGVDYNTGEDYPETMRTAQGLLDFDGVAQLNKESLEGSQAFMGAMVNSHNWYGLLSTLTTEKFGLNWTAGFDGRYYLGFHYSEIQDLLGGKFHMNNDDVNKPENVKLREGDKFNYHNDGEVKWAGLFLQSEYVTDNLSAFVSGAVSSKSYRRIDYFQYKPREQKTDWESFLPWNIKGGANYNLSARHNVFANAGYIKREPIFRNVFLNYTNEVNKDVKFETVITAEVGYGFTSKRLNAKVNYYWTNWLDRALIRSFGQGGTANIPGINALHQGLEAEVTYKPTSVLTLRGMLSLGNWKWQDDVEFTLLDEDRNVIGEFNAYIAGVHVANSAQHTASVSADLEVLPGLKVGADYLFLGKNYADFDPINRTKPEDKVDAWQVPDVSLVDMHANYRFKLGTLDATVYGKVNNLFNVEYVADAKDGADHDAKTSTVYFGFGTTWSSGLKIHF